MDPAVSARRSETPCITGAPAPVDEKELADHQREYLSLNARLAKAWPLITTSHEPLPQADAYASHTDKRALLQAPA